MPAGLAGAHAVTLLTRRLPQIDCVGRARLHLACFVVLLSLQSAHADFMLSAGEASPSHQD